MLLTKFVTPVALAIFLFPIVAPAADEAPSLTASQIKWEAKFLGAKSKEESDRYQREYKAEQDATRKKKIEQMRADAIKEHPMPAGAPKLTPSQIKWQAKFLGAKSKEESDRLQREYKAEQESARKQMPPGAIGTHPLTQEQAKSVTTFTTKPN